MGAGVVKAHLEEILALERDASGVFSGVCVAGSRSRIFGGHVAAQALYAAGLSTPPDRFPESLHGLFLKSGTPGGIVRYHVTTLKDGRALTTHRVDAVQSDQTIFTGFVTFHVEEPSVDLQTPMPDAAPPDEIEGMTYLPVGSNAAARAPFEFRYLDPAYVDEGVAVQPRQLMWFRSRSDIAGPSLAHAGGLVYATDLCLGRTAQLPLRELSGARRGSSLDFAVWFHRALRIDEWLLLEIESSTFANSRALSTGRIFAADGRLVATASQEVLIRLDSTA
jgi:acyl-CoA thioesterase-2